MPADATRRSLLTAAAISTLPVTASARPAKKTFGDVTVLASGVRVAQGKTDIVIRPGLVPGVVEVVKIPRGAAIPDGFFTHADSRPDIHVNRGKKAARVTCGNLDIAIDPAGTIAFSQDGRLRLSDTGGALSPPGVHQGFTPARDTTLLGLGQFRDPLSDYRNAITYLAQANSDAVCPLLVSADGWGLLWETQTHAWLDTHNGRLAYDSPDGRFIRYYVLMGADLDGVIAAYRRLTGRAPLLGKWAYGYWQSQERYRTQDELLAVLDGYRARQLPIDVMVQDWSYWGGNDVFSGMVWDKDRFPDPKGLCDAVHAKNAHIIASVWPAFGPKSHIYRDLDAEGLLFRGEHWSGGKVLDITAPRARDIYWRHIENGLIAPGLDGLWTDGCEPEFLSTGNRYVTTASYAGNVTSFAGPIRENLLTFSYYQTRLLYGGMRTHSPQKRPLILTRSVYAGQQAFNAVTWSGDIFAGWQTLKNQVVAAQQISLSGIPYWTCDIGGFLVSHRFPDALTNPAFRELYVRWFQFGAFLPVFRAHGTEIRRELSAFGSDGDPAYDALKAALLLRYRLMPYVYAQGARVTFKDETYLRPLAMDFARDPKIAGFPHQYLFGHGLMACPVTTPLEHTPAYPYEFIPNTAIRSPTGVAAEVAFYEGADFERLIETRQSDDLKMTWSGDLPGALKGKPYSARWKGVIVAEESGLHRFQILTQGLIRFSLGGQVRVASAGLNEGKSNGADGAISFKGHAGDDAYRFEMTLEKGRAYAFALTQSQPSPDVVSLWCEWETPLHRADMRTAPDKTVDVYLPGGADWYVFGTPGMHAGGTVLKLRPALGQMPLFARAGAIVPQSPGIQYATAPVAALDIDVYAGQDGTFDLYDDAGDGHAYEDGDYVLWPLRWDEHTRTLSGGMATGRGQTRPVTLNVTLFDGPRGGTTAKTVAAVLGQPFSLSFA
ncbi:TIM-barrel domain-containing protein [Asticcacaulis solisilvae]|uniref:TIM-barrel domain-containing protein n=1 Tax=Asticcacaulis solisilvae TaxID=1217274 RepID=UPI003FD7A658